MPNTISPPAANLQDICLPFINRGVSNVMIRRVYNIAYAQGHSAGMDEVSSCFTNLMYELFLMENRDHESADLG